MDELELLKEIEDLDKNITTKQLFTRALRKGDWDTLVAWWDWWPGWTAPPKSFLSEIAVNIKPKVGDFYFFPNYLMHCVYPFKNKDTERRSISFNAIIDEDLYNPYGQ